MDPNLLIEYRCACGRLLFKGFILMSIVEIKCKRCGEVRTFKDDNQGARSFSFVIDNDGKIIDACKGVAALEYSRQHVIGKFLFDILPLARDSQYQEIAPDLENYQIKNNTLLLRDRKAPIESHIIPIKENGKQLYRVFNICEM